MGELNQPLHAEDTIMYPGVYCIADLRRFQIKISVELDSKLSGSVAFSRGFTRLGTFR